MVEQGSRLRLLLFEAEISGQARLAHEEGKAQGSPCWTEERKMGTGGGSSYTNMFSRNSFRYWKRMEQVNTKSQRCDRTLALGRRLQAKREEAKRACLR